MDWNDPEWVRFFAEREPDVRLGRILREIPCPGSTRVLDLGCAAGRNMEALLRAGCEAYALDRAGAMIAATRERVRQFWPLGTGRGRVLQGDMRTLPYRDGIFDLVVAIGIFHEAERDIDLLRSLRETRRILRPGGRVLVSMFGVEMLPPGSPRVEGQRFLYKTSEQERQCRVSPRELEELGIQSGFKPLAPVEIRRREEGDRKRVTLIGWWEADPKF